MVADQRGKKKIVLRLASAATSWMDSSCGRDGCGAGSAVIWGMACGGVIATSACPPAIIVCGGWLSGDGGSGASETGAAAVTLPVMLLVLPFQTSLPVSACGPACCGPSGVLSASLRTISPGRHVGKMRQADHQHFGSGAGMWRGSDLGMAFQQHLPGAAKAGNALSGKRGLLGIEKLFRVPPAAFRLARCTRSRRSAMIISGSAPFAAMAVASAASPVAMSPAMALVRMAMGSRRPGRPSISAMPSRGQAVGRHRRRLVEKGQRVADRSLGGAGNGGDGFGLGDDGFLSADRSDARQAHLPAPAAGQISGIVKEW